MKGRALFGGLIARSFNARSQTQANLVGYASVGVAFQDVLGGHSDAVVADLESTAQLVRQSRLRLLAVTTAKRISGCEQAPALTEILPGFEMIGWFGLVAPTGTPAAIVARVNVELGKILADKEVADRILAIGPIAEAGVSPEQFGAFLRDENQRWGVVAREIGLLPE